MKNDKPLIWIVGIMTLLLALALGKDVVLDKVSDHVIHKLEKEYSPSPYGPGLDPDKIDLKKISQ